MCDDWAVYEAREMAEMGADEDRREMQQEIDRLRSALQKIASEDYRGNMPSSVQIARRALEG